MADLAHLAKWLSKIAGHVARDELASRPVAWSLVLEGESGKYEVLICGSLTRDSVSKMGGALMRYSWEAPARVPNLKLFVE